MSKIQHLWLVVLAILVIACDHGRERSLRISISDDLGGVAGVHISVLTQQTGAILQSDTTGTDGQVSFAGLPSSELRLEAVLIGTELTSFAAQPVDNVCTKVNLSFPSDFDSGPVVWAERSGVKVQASESKIEYGLPKLSEPRKVKAVLEIDWIDGIEKRDLSVDTAGGRLSIEEVFAEIGLSLEVVWHEALPAQEYGERLWPDEDQLKSLMDRHRNLATGPNEWHLYL